MFGAVSLDAVGVYLAIGTAAVGLAAFIVRHTLGRRLGSIETKLAGHDNEIKDVNAGVGSIRVALARVEGFLARNGTTGAVATGSQDRLPATDLSTRIARDLPEDVVNRLPEGDYPLEEVPAD